MKANALTQLRSQKLIERPVLPAPGHVEAKPAAAKAENRRTTATMSLYPTDLSRMKEIRRVLEDSGIKRVSDSEAVRVALRQVALEPTALAAAYQAMLTDDQRRKHADT